MLKRFAFLIFLMSVLSQNVLAEAPQQAVESFLKTIRTLQFPITDQAKHDQLVRQANAYLDLDNMGIKALGPHWQQANPEDQKAYLGFLWKLIEFIAYPRSAKFMGNYEISYPKVEPANNGFQVYSVIEQQAEGLEIPVEYHLIQKEGQWKIDDIVLDDVSIIEDLKGQFNRIIEESQFPGLLNKMRERLEQAKKDAYPG